ncbi:tape measure protein [Pseudomonas citronellolis]|uniref:Tape measure protein n=1 Tax=Pseudomonas citronellolis TaxID=53408 RepID=A0AAW6P5A6_9PSED|nr:tape measure protein [Pseudomonas citronellolis]MDF3842730.1 tape measure protein [Pseudomonas citronellolis]
MSEKVGSIYYTVEAKTEALLDAEKDVSKSMEKMSSEMNKADKSADNLNTGLSKLAKAIGAVIAASALRDMASMVQKYQEMADRVRLATSSTQEFNTVQARLLQTANGTYRSLQEAQELYIRTADSLRSLGYTTAQAMDVQDSLSYAFVTNATSADRAGAAIDAFSKSINTGKVAADQWETISSAVPTVINQIAAASGKSAAQVRALGAAGKLTATDLSEGLRKALDENAKAAAGMTNNLVDAGVRTKTALTQVLVSIEDQTGALDTLTNGIIAAADAVLNFGLDAQKMESFLQAAAVAGAALASVIAGRLIMGLKDSAAALYASTIGAAAKAKADLAAAQAATVLAAEELVQARAAAEASVGLSTHAAAAQRLAVAETQATAATAALTVAQRAVAGAASVAGVAMAGLRSTLAFLGGPAGLILLAATALVTFGMNAKTASTEIDGLDKAVKDLTKSQAALQNLKIDEALTTLTENAENARRSVELMGNLMKTVDPGSDRYQRLNKVLIEQQAAYEANSQKIRTYMQRQQELQKVINGQPASGGKSTETPTLTNPTPPDESAAKKAAAEAKKRANEIRQGTLENEKAIGDLSQALAQAGLKAQDLAEAQAVMKLNEYATPEQIAQVKALAAALYQAEQAKANKQLLGQVDPIAGENQAYQTELESLKKLNDAKLLEEERYQELRTQAEQDHDDRLKQLEEERFRRQSAGNELIMATLDDIQQAGTNAMVGLITGANNGKEAMQQLAGSMLNQVVGALVKVGIEQAKNFIMGQSMQATATAQGVAQAGALAGAYAPAAAAASVASFGGAATAGLAAMAAAIPTMLGLFGGRQYGGGVQANGLYRINENGAPEVFNAANGRQYMLPNSRGEVVSNRDAAAGSSPAVNVSVNLHEDASRAGQVTKSVGPDGEVQIDAWVANLLSDGKTSKAISQAFGLKRRGT